MLFAYLVLAAVVISAGIAAVRSVSLIRAAIALCIGNCALAILFFLLKAPLAGSVYLSVGAGLLSALFIIAISLTESMRGGPREE